MASKLPIGVDNFSEIIKESYQFADKSLFIKEILEDGAKVIVITRPRRFGKTLNLSMLYHFLQENKSQSINLFKDLAIAKDVGFCKKHQQKYPVIFISFKDIKKASFTEAYQDIERLMKDLYSDHRYLLEGDLLHEDEKAIFTTILNQEAKQSNVESAIVQLSKYLKIKFGKNAIILIDEYDTPIQAAYLNDYYKQMIDLMRSILGQALKGNTSLHKAIVTGIARIAQESLFSGVNNLEVYSMLREKYGQYFGFTEQEVVKLIAETGQEVDLNKIKEWYNGYQVGRYVLYNPWSIINCLKNDGALEPYWLNTASNELIKELLTKADHTIKKDFELLLQGKVIEKPLLKNLVFPELAEKEEAIWSLLFYAGYLNVVSSELRGFELMAQVSVPNKEVMYVYDEIVAGWFRRGTSLAQYKKFVDSLKSGDMDSFKRYLSEYILETGSYFDFNKNTPEAVFHAFMLGLVVGLKDHYIIQSNQVSGLGRFDVAFIPKDKNTKGILLEFKTSQTLNLLSTKAMEGLEQLKSMQYSQAFKQHGVKSVLAIGMAFCGQQMEMVHENLQLTK